jgi:exopolysaccharide biosynthesis operon protein EpsL
LTLFRLAILVVLLAASRMSVAQLLVDERLLWDQRLFEIEKREEQDRPLQLRVFGGFRHDSNLFRLSSDADSEAILGTSDKSDNIYLVGAGARVEMEKSRQKFFIDGSAEQSWYQNFDDLDNATNSLLGQWDWQMGNDWSGKLGAGHRRYMESFANIQENVKDMINRDRVYGSANYQPVSYLRFTLDGDWVKTDHGADTRQELDSRADSAAFTVSWVTPAENTMGIRVRTTDATYDDAPASSGVASRDYTEDEYSFVATWRATGASIFRGRLGRTEREFDQSPERNFSGPTWRLGYEWEPTGKSALELAIWRELHGFEDLTGNYVRTTGIGIFPAWSVMPKLILQGKALYQTRDYFGDVTPVSGQREDQERLFQVAAVWTPLRLTKLILAVEAGDRSSNQALADFDYQAVSIAAIRTF